jgi:hypothetical protein
MIICNFCTLPCWRCAKQSQQIAATSASLYEPTFPPACIAARSPRLCFRQQVSEHCVHLRRTGPARLAMMPACADEGDELRRAGVEAGRGSCSQLVRGCSCTSCYWLCEGLVLLFPLTAKGRELRPPSAQHLRQEWTGACGGRDTIPLQRTSGAGLFCFVICWKCPKIPTSGNTSANVPGGLYMCPKHKKHFECMAHASAHIHL